ncbi:hypothetical protein CC80DRAFT_494072 [Byssothecium circinans]|uniref:Alpha/beta hydrolase fold-3 domain-containing protein n=1 Tax=Byssothecium circinans TaxID=147558 RepID=A0A6A5TPV8_9PLEO|nr:hypothetical protein CC80DRAFT_494072 [Byssothecium circinans]
MSESAKESSPERPLIHITTRHERSLYTLIIHAITRPFQSHLGRPKEKQPEGSVALSPPKSTKKKTFVEHHTVCDINVYDIRAKTSKAADCKKRIYYFGGGGWQSPPSVQHWKLCMRMARDVPGVTVTLVYYPLAPNNPAAVSFPWLMRFYRTIMRAADEAGERIILSGDSSGGNVVLSLVLEAL